MSRDEIMRQLAAIAGGVEASLGDGGEMTPAEVAQRAVDVWVELRRRVVFDAVAEAWDVAVSSDQESQPRAVPGFSADGE